MGSRFDTPVFARIDSMIMFQQWSYDKGASPHGVHHLIKDDAYSVRWTGQLEPQFTQEHKFFVQGGGGFRLWINGRLIIDSWLENADNSDIIESEAVELTMGRKYDIRLETFNAGGARACQLYWKCAGLSRMTYVPQSQLYPDAKIRRWQILLTRWQRGTVERLWRLFVGIILLRLLAGGFVLARRSGYLDSL